MNIKFDRYDNTRLLYLSSVFIVLLLCFLIVTTKNVEGQSSNLKWVQEESVKEAVRREVSKYIASFRKHYVDWLLGLLGAFAILTATLIGINAFTEYQSRQTFKDILAIRDEISYESESIEQQAEKIDSEIQDIQDKIEILWSGNKKIKNKLEDAINDIFLDKALEDLAEKGSDKESVSARYAAIGKFRELGTEEDIKHLEAALEKENDSKNKKEIKRAIKEIKEGDN